MPTFLHDNLHTLLLVAALVGGGAMGFLGDRRLPGRPAPATKATTSPPKLSVRDFPRGYVRTDPDRRTA